MLFAPEIRFQSLSVEQLEQVAQDLQQALPDVSITPINKQARSTQWHNKDAVAFRVHDVGQKKPFLDVGLKGAVVASKYTTGWKMDRVLDIVAKLEAEESDNLGLGVICTLSFLALIAYTVAERTTPHSYTLAIVFSSALLLFLVGLVLLCVRSLKAPKLGRSGYAIAIIAPALIMMAPLSMLNLPLLNGLKREQGRRLLQENRS